MSSFGLISLLVAIGVFFGTISLVSITEITCKTIILLDRARRYQPLSGVSCRVLRSVPGWPCKAHKCPKCPTTKCHNIAPAYVPINRNCQQFAVIGTFAGAMLWHFVVIWTFRTWALQALLYPNSLQHVQCHSSTILVSCLRVQHLLRLPLPSARHHPGPPP